MTEQTAALIALAITTTGSVVLQWLTRRDAAKAAKEAQDSATDAASKVLEVKQKLRRTTDETAAQIAENTDLTHQVYSLVNGAHGKAWQAVADLTREKFDQAPSDKNREAAEEADAARLARLGATFGEAGAVRIEHLMAMLRVADVDELQARLLGDDS